MEPEAGGAVVWELGSRVESSWACVNRWMYIRCTYTDYAFISRRPG